MPAAAMFSSAAAMARDVLFPPTCLGCHELTDVQGTLCPRCWAQVRFIERPYCEALGTPFALDQGEGMLSGDALADPPPFRRMRAVAHYGGLSGRLVQALKYSDRTELARWMAAWMARSGAQLLADADIIVPVPLHRWRYFTRRFNQSAELARHLSRLCGKPFDPEALERTRRTRRQVGLGANERQDNVRGAFAVADEMAIRVNGRTVLLIDDVYTTGATVKAATKALLAAGAAHVDVLTFARVVPGDYAMQDVTSI